ncbi:MAG: MetQ/NlpA family ABC transporter substrate-binding protein [Eubacteriales bacterium]|nr:MetQ/NlpA family ABC transporter substrate-binding protein [Eubacteriales bacterium]MDD3214456.1 MetQ/NlpA family ABC transporter substrate-binding protein [Eubacteriales bacterium]
MKKLVAVLLTLALTLALAMTPALANEKITVIATENPHAEILELVKDDLAALGYDLDMTIVTDYVVENPATSDGSVMANFFQHIPYLNSYNDSVSEDQKLVGVVFTHFEPMAIYAGTKTSLNDIADGDRIAIPNDPTNENRALLLLQDAGLITLPEDATLESTCTPLDIVDNPYNLDIYEVNAELIPGLRSDVAYAVINGNNAVLAELVPYVDGLYAEGSDSLAAKNYVNLIAVRPENADADWVKALQQVIYTQKVYDLIVSSGFAPTFTPNDATAE